MKSLFDVQMTINLIEKKEIKKQHIKERNIWLRPHYIKVALIQQIDTTECVQ